MSNTPKEVQEAAERRRKHIAAMSSNSREKSSYWIPIRQELSQHWEAGDAFVLADAYLLSVREDDAIEVDKEWLLSVGFTDDFTNHPGLRLSNENLRVTHSEFMKHYRVFNGSVAEIENPTRGQMRLLAKAYGITLKE